MFANFVDDMVMKISHVLRGEDHLTNTAGQAALFDLFGTRLPLFWHMPILTNTEGKKLSKRDFGFSLNDLRDAGFLPEAICNYLAIIGGSYEEEIMSLDELAKTINFDEIHTTGHIKYDVEKLRWVNRKWIARYEPQELVQACMPYLLGHYPEIKQMDAKKLAQILQVLKTDLVTLTDSVEQLAFYFKAPEIDKNDLVKNLPQEMITGITEIVAKHVDKLSDLNTFVESVKADGKQRSIATKHLFWYLRLVLMGQINGPSIHDLLDILGTEEAKKRIMKASS